MFPWISFLGEPWQETVTSEGQVLGGEDIGITLHIPPGAIPEDIRLNVTIRPCLSGPFVLPEGYRFVSPVYLIKPAFHFSKKVKLSITHFFYSESEEDCGNMDFISTCCIPHYEDSGPKYKFKVLPGGVFLKDMQEASLSIEHFCGVGVAVKNEQRSAGKLHVSL